MPTSAAPSASGERDEQRTSDTTPSIMHAVEALTGAPIVGGNQIEVLRNGEEIFPAMLDAIASATELIEMTTFVWWPGDVATDFAEALSSKAREGVTVRLIVDGFGALRMHADTQDQLRSAGVQVHQFRRMWRSLPADMWHRTHRKLLIVDGRLAITGGTGIADEWAGKADEPAWRETACVIRGPAVADIRPAFLTNWVEAASEHGLHARELRDRPAASGDATVQVVRGQMGRFMSDVGLAIHTAMRNAQRRVWIETAYFTPDPQTLAALRELCERDVEVRAVVPGPKVDKNISWAAARSTYEGLLQRGVELFEYQPSMLHCKVMIVDDLAIVGSANLNSRSMLQDDEVIAIIDDPSVTETLAGHFTDDVNASEQIDPTRWKSRPMRHRIAQRLTTPFHRWL